MTSLKTLLNLKDLRTTDKIEQRFEKIANELFKNYHIQKGALVYDFSEIEFYYYCKGHEDIITYPRNAQAGDWFFHNSGLDLTLESKLSMINKKITEDSYFGGILIRCLRKRRITGQEEDEYIAGPLRCSDELFDQFSAVDYDERQYPHIEVGGQSDCQLNSKVRWIKYKEKDSKFQSLNKQFVCQIKENDFNKYYDSKKYRYYNSDINLEGLKSYPANPWKKEF